MPEAQSETTPLLAEYWPQYELPPVGMIRPEDHDRVYSYIQRRKQECYDERQKWTPMRDQCITLFNIGDISDQAQLAPSDEKPTTNHLQNGALRIFDVLLRDPPLIKVKPVDDAAGSFAWYYNGPPTVPQQGPSATDPATGMTVPGQMIRVDAYKFFNIQQPAEDPVTGEMIAQPLADEIEASRIEKALDQLGWPSKWLLHLDAKEMGDFYQKPFDIDWKDCHAVEFFDSWGMEVIKGGWADGLYMYDEYGHTLMSIPVYQAFIDPSKQFVWEADCHAEVVYPINQAMRLFPDYAEKLYAASDVGVVPTLSTGETAGYSDQRVKQARTIILTTSWLRDEPAPDPMTPQKAIRRGFAKMITQQQVMSPEDVMQQLPTQAPATTQTLVNVSDGMPLTPDENGMVWHDTWPMKKVLRQIVMLDKDVLEDDIAPYPQPNLIHATCIGTERNPYGWGIVWKPRHAQQTYSQSTRSISRNTEYYGNACSWRTRSMDLSMKGQLEDGFLNPGTDIIIDDKLVPPSGKLNFFIDPPNIPDSVITARRETKMDIDELMGVQQALRGEAVTADASGELQKTAQASAVGLISAIGKQITGAIGHTADLVLHSIVHYCDVDHIFECCKKYTREVTAAIHIREAPKLKWGTEVTLASSAQRNQEIRIERLERLNAQIDPKTQMPVVPTAELQEAIDLDPAQCLEQNRRAVIDAIELQAEMMPEQPQVDENGKPVKDPSAPSSNGNGNHNGNGNPSPARRF